MFAAVVRGWRARRQIEAHDNRRTTNERPSRHDDVVVSRNYHGAWRALGRLEVLDGRHEVVLIRGAVVLFSDLIFHSTCFRVVATSPII